MTSLTLTNFGGEYPARPSQTKRGLTARIAQDVDLSSGTIRPTHEDRKVDSRTGRTLFVEDCCTQVYRDCVDVTRVPVPCVRYFRTGVKPYLEETTTPCGDWCRSGFPCITKAPTMTLTPVETYEKVISRSYVYTYTKADGSESQASPVSEIVNSDWDTTAIVSGFLTPPAEYCITGVNVYSTAPQQASLETPEADMVAYFKVATIRFPIAGNIYTHNPSTTQYGSALLIPDLGGPPPDGLSQVQYWNGSQLAGLADGVIYFTEPREFHKWNPDYALKPFSKPVRFISANPYGYILTCGQPEVINLATDCKGGRCHNITRLTEPFPIIGARSAAVTSSSVVYASDDGLVMLSGAQAGLLTDEVFTRDQWLALHPTTMVGVVYNGHYYGFSDVATIKVRLPDKVFAAEQNAVVTRSSVRANHAYVADNGRLYYVNAAGVFEFEGGAGYKPYIWESEFIRKLDRRQFKHLTIDGAVGEPVRVEVSRECSNNYAVAVNVTPCQKVPLARSFRFDAVRVKLTGKTEVFEVTYASPYSS